MSLRAKRLLIRLAVHTSVLALLAVFIVIGSVIESPGLSGTAAILFLFYALTIRINPVPQIIERQRISEVGCEYCGEMIQMNQTWSCACKFVSWEPRHALEPCEKCDREFEWLECPRCNASIMT